MVLISDGKGRGRPARLQLTKDQLTIQVPVMSESESDSASPAVQEIDLKPRTVTLQRAKGGLGLSIKGGQDGNQVVPIVISKLMIGLPGKEDGLR
uniref:PDZ domain-containing protein n=1 Tax=Steinernema glaseri TaxID=37863 RepID=A0A1I8A3V1_9BILA